MSYRVFISHSAKDRPVVDVLRAHVEAIGFTTYLYERETEAGRPVSDKIQAAIRESDAVVALLTNESAGSAFLHQEIGYALALKKLVLPLVDTNLSDPPFAMLEGTEYVPLDPNAPGDATLKMTQSLHRWRTSRSQDQLVTMLVIVGLIVLLLWWQAQAQQ